MSIDTDKNINYLKKNLCFSMRWNRKVSKL